MSSRPLFLPIILFVVVSYASDEAERYKRVAHLTDKTLKDAKPADLPVEEEVRVHHQFENGQADRINNST